MTTQISDWSDLDAVRNDLTADYELVTDLDQNTSGYSGIGDDFEPIGDDPFNGPAFEGRFDGGGHVIRDLVIDQPTGAVGLFNLDGAASGETIVDLGVIGAAVTLDGYNGGVLVGTDGFSDAVIRNCIVSGAVEGTSDYVGGLGGYLSGATVERCIAAVDVTASGSGAPAGGFASSNDGGTIRECFAVGSSTDGGFLGNFSGSEIDCYFDADAAGTSSTAGDAVGLSTAAMTGDAALDNLEGFDFISEWSPAIGGHNAGSDGYPIPRTLPVAVGDAYQSASVTSLATRLGTLSASVSSSSPPVSLSWPNRSHPSDQRLYRAAASSPTWPADYTAVATLADSADTTSDAALVDGGTYSYRVAAVDAAGDPITETSTDAVTLAAPLEALSVAAADADGPGVEATWTRNWSTLDTIDVYRAPGETATWPDDFAEVLSVDGAATSALDGTVATETDYVYRVTGTVDGVGDSTPTDPATITTPAIGPFEIAIVSTNSPVGVGDTLAVDVEITNTGPYSGDTDVAVDLTEQ